MPDKDQKTIPGNDFFKSLGKLEALAKGNQTEDEDLSKAQLFHTKASSEKKTWPGGDTTDIGNNWKDSIGADGTDYKAARKAISDKILKGEALIPEEIALLKGDLENSVAKSKAAEEEAREDKEGTEGTDKSCGSVEKSFSGSLEESQTIQDALEMSDFLQEFTKSFGAGLGQLETRTSELVSEAVNTMATKLGTFMEERFEEQADFNKSLADAVVNIGHGVAGTVEQQAEIAAGPAGPPKSQAATAAVNVIEKSFAGPAEGTPMSKSQKLDVMCELVEKGKINSIEVLKFETSGELRPDIDAMITNRVQSGGSN